MRIVSTALQLRYLPEAFARPESMGRHPLFCASLGDEEDDYRLAPLPDDDKKKPVWPDVSPVLNDARGQRATPSETRPKTIDEHVFDALRVLLREKLIKRRQSARIVSKADIEEVPLRALHAQVEKQVGAPVKRQGLIKVLNLLHEQGSLVFQHGWVGFRQGVESLPPSPEVWSRDYGSGIPHFGRLVHKVLVTLATDKRNRLDPGLSGAVKRDRLYVSSREIARHILQNNDSQCKKQGAWGRLKAEWSMGKSVVRALVALSNNDQVRLEGEGTRHYWSPFRYRALPCGFEIPKLKKYQS